MHADNVRDNDRGKSGGRAERWQHDAVGGGDARRRRACRKDGDVHVNGTSAGSAVTDGTGLATLANASLASIDAGTYPTGVGASFAGDAAYTASSGTAQLTVTAGGGPQPSTIAVVSGSGTYGSTATLTATLTSGGSGLSDKTVAFTLNGADAGSATTDASGIATVTGVSLSGIDAGSYAGAVGASFAGDTGYSTSSGSGDLTVAKANQTITIGTHAPSSDLNTSRSWWRHGGVRQCGGLQQRGRLRNVAAAFTITSGTGTHVSMTRLATLTAAAHDESVARRKPTRRSRWRVHAPRPPSTAAVRRGGRELGRCRSAPPASAPNTGATFTMTSGAAPPA